MFCRLVTGLSGAGRDQCNHNSHLSLRVCVVAPHSGLRIPAFSLLWKSLIFLPVYLCPSSVSSFYHCCPHRGNKLLAAPIRRCLNETLFSTSPPPSTLIYNLPLAFPCTGLIFSWQSGKICAIFQWLLLHMRKVDLIKMLSDCTAALSAKRLI